MKNSIAEKLLLCYPDMRKIYLKKYEIYKLLNLPLDLFFNEDIINYKEKYYKINVSYYNEINMVMLNKPTLSNPFNITIGPLMTGKKNNDIYYLPPSVILSNTSSNMSYIMFNTIFTKQPLTPTQERLIIENVDIMSI